MQNFYWIVKKYLKHIIHPDLYSDIIIYTYI